MTNESPITRTSLLTVIQRAEAAGIIFEDDLLVIPLCRLVDTLTAQRRTNVA
jgi:hypothetical protein